jgi:hypothetical protein
VQVFQNEPGYLALPAAKFLIPAPDRGDELGLVVHAEPLGLLRFRLLRRHLTVRTAQSAI